MVAQMANNLLDVCAFMQTSGDHVLFHVFISTSHLNRFFVEPFDVVSKRFASSLEDGLK